MKYSNKIISDFENFVIFSEINFTALSLYL
jgi:hypothetical protein